MSLSTVRLMVSCSTFSYKVTYVGNELLDNLLINIQVVIQPSNRKN
jgi:hypothetical protein